MTLGGYEFQVIFCVLLLLGLASVALVVDYLKSMNERLRERHVELLSKHEVVVQRVEEDNTRLLRALAEQSKAFREMNKRSITVNTKLTQGALPEITLTPIAPPVDPVLSTAGPVAVADPQPTPEPLAAEDSLPPNVVRIRLKQQEEEESKPESNDFDTFMERLVNEPGATPAEAVQSLEQLAQTVSEFSGELPIPAGTHPPAMLHQLIDSDQLLNGLVMSIGINDYMKLAETHGREAAGQLLNTVDSVVSELAGDTGFTSRISDDEFVLIIPSIGGAAAQQKIAAVAERLWDYQLQTLGTFLAVFSWGAVEAQRMRLADALTDAAENMAETRATRRGPTSETGNKKRATA